jgi:hypothetical protein
MRLVFLDTGPLGILTNPKGTPDALACQQWVRGLLAAQVRVVVPAIADYELRRELIRAGKIAGLRRLDAVAANEALDGDAILAAQALVAVGPGDVVTIATDNVGHLSRFVDAEVWTTIQP